MARHDKLSRRPVKEQPAADMCDDKTTNTTTDYTHIPLPSLAPSIPCPASDRCPTVVPVGALRRSAPAISRFCPFRGWRTILRLLACRAAESNAFSVHDRNALWNRAEDGLLVQTVAKYSTWDVLSRDWSEVAWELPGRSEQQCKERYSLADTVVQLTFVFLRVIFRGSPGAFRSSHVLTKNADSADSGRPLHYSKSDSRLARAPALSPCYSLTHAHRFTGYHNRNPQPVSQVCVMCSLRSRTLHRRQKAQRCGEPCITTTQTKNCGLNVCVLKIVLKNCNVHTLRQQ
jgi:hypothetical protein